MYLSISIVISGNVYQITSYMYPVQVALSKIGMQNYHNSYITSTQVTASFGGV